MVKIGTLIKKPSNSEKSSFELREEKRKVERIFKSYDKSNYVLMLCRISGTVKIHGIPSRTEYTFSDENKIIPVKKEDVPDLLSKKQKRRPCCNSENDNLDIFEIYTQETHDEIYQKLEKNGIEVPKIQKKKIE